VGKTELAKALAEYLFGSRDRLVRIDMGEYLTSDAVARLLGDAREAGLLPRAVRRQPFCVVLLDEVEKAHPAVFDALLGVLGEARLTDAAGRVTDFRNAVIVMTSNLGAETFAEASRSIGFGRDGDANAPSSRALAAARASLPPELWNRIDEPVVFAPLARAEVSEVAQRMLRDAGARLSAEQGVTLAWDDGVIAALLDGGGYEPSLGARPMRRALSRLVESPVAEAVLRGELRRGDVAILRAREGRIEVRAARSP
jgi:ATP-dependent Clp protease ATP-binding subunit ClpC